MVAIVGDDPGGAYSSNEGDARMIAAAIDLPCLEPAGAADLPAALYDALAQLAPSPVVELNRAVAVAMADGPAAGLALVEALAAAPQLHGYYLLHATRADLLRRLGRGTEAAESYRQALALADSDAERRFFARRLAEVTTFDSSP